MLAKGLEYNNSDIFWIHTNGRVLNEEFYAHILQKLFFPAFIYRAVPQGFVLTRQNK